MCHSDGPRQATRCLPAKPAKPATSASVSCFSPLSPQRALLESSVLYLMSPCFLVVYRASPGSGESFSGTSATASGRSASTTGATAPRITRSGTWEANLFSRVRPSPSRHRRRTSPHLTAVGSGTLSEQEQDDGQLIRLAAHSPVGGVIRDAQRRGAEVRSAEVYAGLFVPNVGDLYLFIYLFFIE